MGRGYLYPTTGGKHRAGPNRESKIAYMGRPAQQVVGADLVVENPFDAGLVFAALQVKFGDTAPAAWRPSSRSLGIRARKF